MGGQDWKAAQDLGVWYGDQEGRIFRRWYTAAGCDGEATRTAQHDSRIRRQPRPGSTANERALSAHRMR